MKTFFYLISFVLIPIIGSAQSDNVSTGVFLNNGYLGLGTSTPSHLLTVTSQAINSRNNNNKEELAKFSLFNDSKSSLIIGNSTTSNDFYVPSIKGFTAMRNQPGLVIRGITSTDNDNSNDALVHITPYILDGDTLLYPKNRHFLGIQGYETGVGQKSLLEIDEKGYVGIGTDDPIAKLHISDGDIYIADINKGIIMKSPDGNSWRGVLDNSGNLIFSLTSSADQAIITKSSNIESIDIVTIYPNPSNDIITISFGLNVSNKNTYTINTLSGSLVELGKLKSKKTSLDITGLSSGIYVLNICDKKGTIIASEKIVKE